MVHSRPEPLLREVAQGITQIDTGMAGRRELNAVYVIRASEPCLIETGPGSDAPTIADGLAALGLGPRDLAHLVVTHIHMDHAGGAGDLLRRFPGSSVTVHEAGARHLADPGRLIASTARTYGEERMLSLYGRMLPCEADRVRPVRDGSSIALGDRSLRVIHTPGHASHHVALLDDVTGALFTGEAIGSYLPWADAYRPALPPPEVDVEAALASIDAMRALAPMTLLTSHFGAVDDPEDGFTRAAARIRSWAEIVRVALLADPHHDEDAVVTELTFQARREFEADADGTVAFELDRYDALGSIRMNAQGLTRYWRKRWETEAAQES